MPWNDLSRLEGGCAWPAEWLLENRLGAENKTPLHSMPRPAQPEVQADAPTQSIAVSGSSGLSALSREGRQHRTSLKSHDRRTAKRSQSEDHRAGLPADDPADFPERGGGFPGGGSRADGRAQAFAGTGAGDDDPG